MTITRKPRRPAATQAGKAAGAEEFIKAASHKPAEPAAEPPVPAPAPAPTAQATPAPAPVAEDKKPVKKDKKHKDKKKKSKKKEAVLIRFDDGQLTRIDSIAEKLGLSRAAWVRMVVSKALPEA